MTKTKLSAYQKLKAENLKLRQDIHTILRGDFESKLIISTQWNMQFNLEDIVWGKYQQTPTEKITRPATEILDELILKTPDTQKENGILWLGKPIYERLISEIGKVDQYKGFKIGTANIFTQEQAFIMPETKFESLEQL